MSLFSYKGSIVVIITLVTLVAGFTSLRFIRRYQHFLDVGNAFTDGIFLGTAAFHIFPDSLQGIPIMLAILITFVGFFLLFIFERWIIYREKKRQAIANDYIRTAVVC